jgi:hypothetical protein
VPLSLWRARSAGPDGGPGSQQPARPAGADRASRARVATSPWGYLVRSVWWQPIVVAAVVAAVVARLAGLDPVTERFLAALLLALGTALVLDDPAAATLAASPTTLWRRRRRRLALALVLVGVAWVAVDRVAGHPDAGLIPPGPATLVLGTLLGVVLASAAVAGGEDQLGGAAAGPVLLGFVLVVARLPERWSLLPVAGHERRWGLVLAATVLALLAASRDPAARRPLARRARG